MSYTFHQTGQQIQDLIDYGHIRDTVTVSSLPMTVTKEGMTANHDMVWSYVENESAKTSAWDVETAEGSYTIRGSISGTTRLHLKFDYYFD